MSNLHKLKNSDVRNYESAKEIGIQATADKFNICVESVKRSIRRAKETGDREPFEKSKSRLLHEISELYTKEELKALANSLYKERPKRLLSFDGDEVRIGIMTDTHIGSKFFNPSWFATALQEFEDYNCSLIIHTGDVTEGMSNRPDHFLSLEKVGYKAQKEYAISLFQDVQIPIYAIAGNHDEWYLKAIGADIVEDISKELPNFHYLGMHEADITINGVRVKLWHGKDGAAKTISLRPQNILDILADKPDLLLLGHDHKRIYFKQDKTHVIACGALSEQTDFMRYSKLKNMAGFNIVDLIIRDGSIIKIAPMFYDL